MRLTPRYGSNPLVTLDGNPADIAAPAIRQRRRLAAVLATFNEEQWAYPSRCESWSNRDVIIHLESTNGFWAFAITSGLQGEPTRFLATFDPVTSPAELVANSTSLTSQQVLDRFVASTNALAELWASMHDGGWSTLAEAPPGHVSISAVTHHALWDSWVHERDILLPLGIVPDEEADEIAACLRYGAALSPALALSQGSGRGKTGTLAIKVTSPDISFVVEIGEQAAVTTGATTNPDLLLTGDAVALLEALSIRRPLDQEVPTHVAWMVNGLAETFDAPVQRNV